MKKILGYLPDADIVQSMAVHLADGGKPDNESRLRGPFRKEKIAWLISGILLLPDFQVR